MFYCPCDKRFVQVGPAAFLVMLWLIRSRSKFYVPKAGEDVHGNTQSPEGIAMRLVGS
jgi:hypothetical protein